MMWKSIKRSGIAVIALVPSLLVVGAALQLIVTKIDETRFPPIGKLVDVGGYRLHMHMTGKNRGPTVVLDAGLGCSCLDWSLVQPEISHIARVVSYDRAGYGWSDSSPLPRTSENIVTELHTMLHNAGVSGPYILVGHSFGGLNLRLFAERYPNEISGIVLVDAAHEELLRKMPPFPHSSLQKLLLQPKVREFCSMIGLTRFFHTYFPMDKSHELLPESVRLMYFAATHTLKFSKVQAEEFARFDESGASLRESCKSLGNKPLIVITAGLPPTVQETGYSKEFIQEAKAVWNELQQDLTTKSRRTKQVIAEESGHMINHEQPHVIVDAVKEIINR